MAKSDPRAALVRAGEIGGADGRTLVADIVGVWSQRDGRAAVDWIAQEIPPAERNWPLFQALTQWARNQPQDATAYALTLPPGPERTSTLSRIMQDWVLRDANGAFDSLSALTQDRGFPDIIESAARAFAMSPEGGTDAALAMADRFSEGLPREAFLAGLVKFGADNNVDYALRIVPLLPEGAQRKEALNHLVEVWARKDAVKAAAWLNTLPSSPSADAAVGHFANVAVELDPATAVLWAASIQNSQTRRRYLGSVYAKWRTKSPQAAEMWLHETKALTSEEKAGLGK